MNNRWGKTFFPPFQKKRERNSDPYVQPIDVALLHIHIAIFDLKSQGIGGGGYLPLFASLSSIDVQRYLLITPVIP
jgi:hypothetical protein